jgi:tetratricopeptide (TPR) repeat protein
LRPKAVLAKALAEWDECCPPLGYSPIEQNMREIVIASIHAWLPLLKERPELWNAFEVLDAVATAAHDFNYAGVDVAVAMPILERGERMLREVLKTNAAEGLRLEWGWRENRPALSLLGSRIAAGASAPVTPQDIERLEWLVLTLNPNDNQGFRDVLLRRYLEAGRLENALALAERYADDFAAMRYNRVLTLFAAGRSGAAVSALGDAAAKYPKPLAWLLKPNPKPPRQDPHGVVVGGDEEAWLYRNETLPLWEKLGALDWLRSTAAALRPARSAPRAKSK